MDKLEFEKLIEEKNKFIEKQKDIFDFEANGYPFNSLSLYKIDKEYFNALPEDIKKEVLTERKSDYDKEMEEKEKEKELERKKIELISKKKLNFLHETLLINKLYKDQEENSKPFDNEKTWEEFCKLLSNQSDDFKKEVLFRMDNDLIHYLPKNLKNFAYNLKKNKTDFFDEEIIEGETPKNIIKSQKYLENPPNTLLNNEKIKYNQNDLIENEIIQQNSEFLFEENPKDDDYEEIFNKPDFYLNLPLFTDSFLFKLAYIYFLSDNYQCSGGEGSNTHNSLLDLIQTISYNPINAYKIINAIYFITLNSTHFLKEYGGKYITNDRIDVFAARLLERFIRKKISLSILIDSTQENNGLVKMKLNNNDENLIYDPISNITELRAKFLKENNEKLENIHFPFYIINISAIRNFSFEIIDFFSIIAYSDTPINRIKYPKIQISKSKMEILLNFFKNPKFSINFNFDLFFDKFENYQINFDLLLIVIKQILKESEIYLKEFRNKIVEWKKEKQSIICISTIEDITKKKDLWNNVYDFAYHNAKSYLKILKRNFVKIMIKLKEIIEVQAKIEAKKQIDLSLKTENFNEYILKYEEISNNFLNQIREKFKEEFNTNKENAEILKILRNFINDVFITKNLIGTDFTKDDYHPMYCYSLHSSCIKIFLEIYLFINPSLLEEKPKEEEKLVTHNKLGKLSKMRTFMPEEEKLEKKELKFLQKNVGKIFSSLTRSSDTDFCLGKSFQLLFGELSQIMEILMKNSFIKRTSKNSKYYFYIIKNRPTENSITSEMKFLYLKTISKQKAEQKHSDYIGSISLLINREQIWDSTLKGLLNYSPAELVKGEISINFENEEGIDAGGLKREWLTLLSKEIFNPENGLFKLSENKISYQPNPISYIIPNHLTQFRILGRLIAKCLIERYDFEVFFVKSFLKHILKKTLYIEDLQDIDGELYNSMKWTLENDVEAMGFVFNYFMNIFGELKVIELIPGGSETEVTNLNKKDFVKRMAYAKMANEISEQSEALILGIHEMIPENEISILTEKDLGMRLAGSPKINIDEMQKYANFCGNYNKDHEISVWIFEILRELDDKLKADFLFYVLGTYRVPIGGFKSFPIKISSSSDPKNLPLAHTCFGQIDIPPYSTKEILKEKLMTAITEGIGSGFFIG